MGEGGHDLSKAPTHIISISQADYYNCFITDVFPQIKIVSTLTAITNIHIKLHKPLYSPKCTK